MLDTLEKEEVPSAEIEVEEHGAPARKVELDLDDAPFLQVEEKAPPAPVETDVEVAPKNEGSQGKKKKLILLGGIALGILLVAAAAVWWFMFRTPPPPPVAAPDPEVIVVPSMQTPAGPTELVHEFAAFVVPVNDDRAQTRFLVCKFAAISQDGGVDQEITRQEIPLRDAVYFYLRGKDAAYLQDAHNYDAIKQDLLTVFNDYLSQGKVDDIVFESYLSH